MIKRIKLLMGFVILLMIGSSTIAYGIGHLNFSLYENPVAKVNGEIYYINHNDHDRLYTIQDGKSTKILDFPIWNMVKEDNYIYFLKERSLENTGQYQQPGVYRYNPLVSKVELVQEGYITSMSIKNNNLFYYDEGKRNALIRKNLNTKEEKVIFEDKHVTFNMIKDNDLYVFDDDSSSLYKVDLDSLEKTLVLDDTYLKDIDSLNIDQEYVYYIKDTKDYEYNLKSKNIEMEYNLDTSSKRQIYIGDDRIHLVGKDYVDEFDKHTPRGAGYDYNKHSIVGLVYGKLIFIEQEDTNIGEVYNYETKERKTISATIEKIHGTYFPYIIYTNRDELFIYNISKGENRFVDNFQDIIGIKDDKIYYVNLNHDIYVSTTDGSQRKISASGGVDEAALYGTKILFLELDNYFKKLRCFDTVTNELQEFAIEDPEKFMSKDEYIYYAKNGSIYSSDFSDNHYKIEKYEKDLKAWDLSGEQLILHEGHALSSININTQKKTALLSDIEKLLKVSNDEVYVIYASDVYPSTEYNKILARYNLNHHNSVDIDEGKDINIIYEDNDKIIYNMDTQIKEIDLKTLNKKVLIENVSGKSVYDGANIYYKVKNDKVKVMAQPSILKN
ncbi:DUF5050 domain-containing protein [Lutibacter sp. B2]|nr:DUF5050 domain-containing protein [Lutibacter sp. B2]